MLKREEDLINLNEVDNFFEPNSKVLKNDLADTVEPIADTPTVISTDSYTILNEQLQEVSQIGLLPASPPFTKISSIKMYKKVVERSSLSTATTKTLKSPKKSLNLREQIRRDPTKSYLPRIIKKRKEQ